MLVNSWLNSRAEILFLVGFFLGFLAKICSTYSNAHKNHNTPL